MHMIVNVARSYTAAVARRQMSVLAQRAVKSFPDSLEDRINGMLIGNGYESLLRQLCFRNENLNRMGHKRKTSSESDSSGQPGTSAEGTSAKFQKRDAYGCINFKPKVTNQQEADKQYLKDMYKNPDPQNWDKKKIHNSIELCFPAQRAIINASASTSEIFEEWPCLFEFNGMMIHFEMLVGINLPTVFQENTSVKIKAIRDYLKEVKEHRAIFSEVALLEAEKGASTSDLPAVILALLDHFGDDRKHLFYPVNVQYIHTFLLVF